MQMMKTANIHWAEVIAAIFRAGGPPPPIYAACREVPGAPPRWGGVSGRVGFATQVQ